MTIAFTKMQGLGNDFVVIDATKQSISLNPEQIQKMADRRLGVGFDQLLMLQPADIPDADFRYRIFNSDGSEVAQCGNGARCMARFIQRCGLSSADIFRLQTQKGVLTATVINGHAVCVELGVPTFEPAGIPFQADVTASEYMLKLGGDSVQFGVVNLGNPHAVIRVVDVKCAMVEQWGVALCQHPDFPEGVNVGFMQIDSPAQIHLRVYERGAGETMACGSGMCAAVVSGQQRGWLEQKVRVSQQGGEADVAWQGVGQVVSLTGPAEFVYQGEWTQ